MCLRRRFSQKVSSSDAIFYTLHISHIFGPALHQESSGFHRFCAHFPIFSHIFSPIAPRSLGFSQDVPSSDATFPTIFHILAPLHQESWVLHRIFLYMGKIGFLIVFPQLWVNLVQKCWGLKHSKGSCRPIFVQNRPTLPKYYDLQYIVISLKRL